MISIARRERLMARSRLFPVPIAYLMMGALPVQLLAHVWQTIPAATQTGKLKM